MTTPNRFDVAEQRLNGVGPGPLDPLIGWTAGKPPWISAADNEADRIAYRAVRCPLCRGRMAMQPHYKLQPRRYVIRLQCACGHVDQA